MQRFLWRRLLRIAARRPTCDLEQAENRERRRTVFLRRPRLSGRGFSGASLVTTMTAYLKNGTVETIPWFEKGSYWRSLRVPSGTRNGGKGRRAVVHRAADERPLVARIRPFIRPVRNGSDGSRAVGSRANNDRQKRGGKRTYSCRLGNDRSPRQNPSFHCGRVTARSGSFSLEFGSACDDPRPLLNETTDARAE